MYLNYLRWEREGDSHVVSGRGELYRTTRRKLLPLPENLRTTRPLLENGIAIVPDLYPDIARRKRLPFYWQFLYKNENSQGKYASQITLYDLSQLSWPDVV